VTPEYQKRMMENTTEIEKIAKEMLDASMEHIDSIKPSVFLMGPDMAKDTPGAKLRREIRKRCDEIGLPITAEHPKVEETGKTGMGELYDLTRWELRIASRSDVVIILPDSPGSFAEFGLFSMRKRICPRMLIIFHKDYEDDDSYLQQGPRKAAERRHATVVFVAYSDVEEAWLNVSSYINETKASMADDMM
jgi:hypothetical protein